VPGQVLYSKEDADQSGGSTSETASGLRVGKLDHLAIGSDGIPIDDRDDIMIRDHCPRSRMASGTAVFSRLSDAIQSCPKASRATVSRLFAGSAGLLIVQQRPAPLNKTRVEMVTERTAKEEEELLQDWEGSACTTRNRGWQSMCSVCRETPSEPAKS